MWNKTLKQNSRRGLSANQTLTHTHTAVFLSVTKVRLYLFGIVTTAHIHLQWSKTQRIIAINNRRSITQNQTRQTKTRRAMNCMKSRMTAAVVAVTARNHGDSKYVWLTQVCLMNIFNMKINMLISLKQLCHCFGVLFWFYFTRRRRISVDIKDTATKSELWASSLFR